MKKSTTILLGIFLFMYAGLKSNTSFAQNPWWEWARGAGSTGDDAGSSAAVDAAGNVYATGSYTSASITFGPNTFTNSGIEGSDLFVVKYSATGNVVWAKNIGGTGGDIGHKLVTDGSGNVYVAGWFSSPSIAFGATTLTNSGSGSDMFIAKYDASGNVLWARNAAGTGNDAAYGIAVDASGNVYVAGVFASSMITFYSTTLTNTSSGSNEMYVVKYDALGNVLWARTAGGAANDVAYGVAVDASGNVYVTGAFESSSIAFGSTVLTNAGSGSSDIYVVKYDASGNALWASAAGGTGIDISNAVSVDDGGNVFLTGSFTSTGISFGAVTLTNGGYADAYIVKYNTSGNAVWARGAGGQYDETGHAVTAGIGGEVYVTGRFMSATATFGATVLSNKSAGSNDIYVVKYGTTGDVIWALAAGDIYDDAGTGIAVNAGKSVYVTGKFNSSTITFGGTTLAKGCGDDFFVAKLELTLGMGENDLRQVLHIYPNPGRGIFQLSADVQDATVKVTNSMGQTVFSGRVAGYGSRPSIDLSACSPGIYFIELQEREKGYRGKIVVE